MYYTKYFLVISNSFTLPCENDQMSHRTIRGGRGGFDLITLHNNNNKHETCTALVAKSTASKSNDEYTKSNSITLLFLPGQ